MACLSCLSPWLQPACICSCCCPSLTAPVSTSLSSNHESVVSQIQVVCMVLSRDRPFQWLRSRIPGQQFPAVWREGGRCERHLPSALPSSSCGRQRRAELVSADRSRHEKRFLAAAAGAVICNQGQPGLLSDGRSWEQSLCSPLD